MNRHKFILRIQLGLLVASLANNSFAMCSFSGITVFPNTKTISTNPIFIIEGYESSQSVIRLLNHGNAIYLISGNDTIPLTVIKRLESQFRLTQAILKPSSSLIQGKQYKLNIDNLEKYDKSGFDRDQISWTVTDPADYTKPIWIKKPQYSSKEITFFGCGPAVFVTFCASISDNSPVVVYANVKSLKSDSSSDYYLKPGACSFQLGHGMCSGEFEFEEGEAYEGTFSLMDASGNISAETLPIRFTGPTEKDEINDQEQGVICDCSKQKTTAWITISMIALASVVIVAIVALKRKSK